MRAASRFRVCASFCYLQFSASPVFGRNRFQTVLKESLHISTSSLPATNLSNVSVAACDLDKTLYPPEGTHQAEQLEANIQAMTAFESLGGFVFPVTGNNLLQAQVKFNRPDGSQLRNLTANPGIFTNGGLVLGPGGINNVLERHPLGFLYERDHQDQDFVTAILDMFDHPVNAGLLQGVSLILLTTHQFVGYEDAYFHVEEYAAFMRLTPTKMTRDEILREDVKADVLLALIVFDQVSGASVEEKLALYQKTVKPRQDQVEVALQALGRFTYTSDKMPLAIAHGIGKGIDVKSMMDPWPEMHVNVKGVDKGQALARFLSDKSVLKYLKSSSIDVEQEVAVFGDAKNDVPMFENVGGKKPFLRVRMPHATCSELVEAANCDAEVAEVLNRICQDKLSRASGDHNLLSDLSPEAKGILERGPPTQTCTEQDHSKTDAET